MKSLGLIVVALLSSQAFASKARVAALQGADHVVDTQTAFTVPSHLLLLNQHITFEMGAVGTDAEGGIVRNFGSGKLLAYVGHQNSTASAFNADARTALGYIEQRNPLEIIYGSGNMAYGLSVSNVTDDANVVKETTLIGKWGMNMGDGWVYAHLHAVSTAEDGDPASKFSGNYVTVGGSHVAGNQRWFGRVDLGMGKNDPAATAEVDVNDTNLSLGVEDRGLKTADADIYYGINLKYANRKVDDDNINGTALPVFLGLEAPVTSWATLRGSVQQNLLIGSTKDETATAPADESEGIAANTTVAAGLGLKWGNFVLDGTLTAATSGAVNGNTFLSQAALNYNF